MHISKKLTVVAYARELAAEGGGVLARAARALGTWIMEGAEAASRRTEVDALQALSDDELAARGLR
ncbi:MAG: hypothetical protein AAF813_10040, partial [Pseudomonadota bacterium]